MTKQKIREYAEKLRKEAGIKKFSRKAQVVIDVICEGEELLLRKVLEDYIGTKKEALLLSLVKWKANRYDGFHWSLGRDDESCPLCCLYDYDEGCEKCPLPDCEEDGPWRKTYSGNKRPLMNALRKAWRKLCKL